MFDNYVTFFKERDMLNLYNQDPPNVIAELKDHYKTGFYGLSKSGHPILIEYWGDVNHSYI